MQTVRRVTLEVKGSPKAVPTDMRMHNPKFDYILYVKTLEMGPSTVRRHTLSITMSKYV